MDQHLVRLLAYPGFALLARHETIYRAQVVVRWQVGARIGREPGIYWVVAPTLLEAIERMAALIDSEP